MMKSCAFACFAAASTLKRSACSSNSPSTYNKRRGEERKEDKKEGKRKDGRKNGREGG